MTTQQRIERRGYKVTYCMSGRVMASKLGHSVIADNITQLLKLTRR